LASGSAIAADRRPGAAAARCAIAWARCYEDPAQTLRVILDTRTEQPPLEIPQ